jgi:hypothetical protein
MTTDYEIDLVVIDVRLPRNTKTILPLNSEINREKYEYHVWFNQQQKGFMMEYLKTQGL